MNDYKVLGYCKSNQNNLYTQNYYSVFNSYKNKEVSTMETSLYLLLYFALLI